MAQLCFGCMKQKENKPICEHCGFDERTENQSHQLPMGTILQNQYLIGRVLGQGGFGITYMGWDQHLSVPVAIKEYFPGGLVQRNTRWSTDVMCSTGEAPGVFARHRERFLKEARTLAQLSGIPEIVQIKSFFPENGTAYIVMEYVEGITLKDHLKKLGRPLSEEEALTIMEPVLKALQKVHGHGLIHRDISPDNIMLPVGGGVKLIDFGTVRYMDDSGKSKSTEAVLKPGFAPMEQYNTRGNIGPWTDVYALCATFHYLLTGKAPLEVLQRLESGENLTMLRSRQGLSPKLIRALEKGMEVKPQDRLQSVEELHKLLYTQKRQKKEKTAEKVPPKQTTKKRWFLVLMAALLAVSALFLLITGQKAPASPEDVIRVTVTEETTVPETVPSVSAEQQLYMEAEALQEQGEYAEAAIAFGKLGEYGDARERSFALWRATIPTQTVAAGAGSAAVVKQDGSVLHISATDVRQNAAVNWRDVVSVSVGYSTTVGLKADGTVVSLGTHDVNDWTNMVAVDASQTNVMGLRADGTVTVTGHNVDGLCDDWQDIVAISASSHLVGLKMDGTVVAVGGNQNGQCDVSDWEDIVAISSDSYNRRGITIGLKADGTVEVAGIHYDLSGWTDIVAVAAAVDQQDYFVAGIRADGTLFTAGSGDMVEQIEVGSFFDGHSVAAISASRSGFMALRDDGRLRTIGEGVFIYQESSFMDIMLPSTRPLNSDQNDQKPEEGSAEQQFQYDAAEQLLASGETGKAAIALGKLGDYADSRERSFALWRQVAPCQTIDAGLYSTAAVKEDGTVLLAGYADYRQTDCQQWTDIISVSTTAVGDGGHSVGLKADGTVVAAGAIQWGQCDVSQWTDIVAIDTNHHDTIGLRADGTVVLSGYRIQMQKTIVQEVASWTDIIAVVGHECFAVTGLKSDGTVVTTGDYDVEDWSDIISICGGSNYIVGLKSDGTVVASGQNHYGQCDVSDWKDIIEIDAGFNYTMGLKADGTVLTIGFCNEALFDVSDWTDIAAIYAGGYHAVGIKKDGTLVATGTNNNRELDVENWTDIRMN